MTDNVIIGSRGSALALRQSHTVAQQLSQAHSGLTFEVRIIKTKGDLVLDRPLADIGDKGLFVKELQKALLDGEIHLAVHSLKDLPTESRIGLVLAAVSLREDVRDVLVSRVAGSLEDLPPGARLGTSSRRRASQLRRFRNDLDICDLRGNLDTRLRKLDEGQYEAIVLAAAGIRRLGLDSRITQYLSVERCLPSPGQGALGIEAREGDEFTLKILKTIDDPATHQSTGAERAFLGRLEGGCQIPIGAYAQVRDGRLVLEGMVASINGDRLIRSQIEGTPEQAEILGQELAERVLEMGAGDILREIWTPWRT
ncbi:MAG: hydroxymethylbilane synthase [Dehalococcoidia bacterium]|nr:hydroxymethylbilane synthase [Dehalococcoidia bacterium]